MEDTSNTKNKKIKHSLNLQKKKTLPLLKKIKKIDDAKVENLLLKESKYFSYFYILQQNFFDGLSLHDFITKLFKLKELSGFSKIHLLIHEKGNLESFNYEYTRDSIKEDQFNITTFTNLFNSIKKSKDRSFGEVSLKGTDFDIVGTFLAQELSYRYHSIVFIIGRDDFLPQSKEDKLFFQFLISIIHPFLERLVQLNKSERRNEILANSLKNSLYKFKYYYKKEVIFSNVTHFKHTPTKLIIDQDSFFEIDLDSTKIVNHADIFHQERISLLGDLFNTLKHELSNPLFGLQLSSELLLFENLQTDQVEFIKQISTSIKRSQNLIENFKDLYSKDISFKKLNILDLLEEVLTLTKSNSRNLKININTSESLKEEKARWILSNNTWLAQILFNFILNTTEACTNTLSPALTIDLEVKQNHLSITFTDNGPGIEEKDLKQIFDPFFTTKDEGTGLGLAISKSLSRKLGGELKYIQTGKGASFNLLLPYENTDN